MKTKIVKSAEGIVTMERGKFVVTCPIIPPTPQRVSQLGNEIKFVPLTCNSCCAHFHINENEDVVKLTCGNNASISVEQSETKNKNLLVS